MRVSDSLFLVMTFASMGLGLIFPQLAEPMAAVPRICMMTLLFISFLAMDPADVVRSARRYPLDAALAVAAKLLITPLVCWLVFRLLLPEYSLGALLAGGASTGMIAPFFAMLAGADFVLVLVCVVASSLLVPLTLPLVLSVAGTDGSSLPLAEMTVLLGVTMFLPFVAAGVARRLLPGSSAWLVGNRSLIGLVVMSIGNFAIFCRYSPVIRQDPSCIPPALAAAVLLSVVLLACGLLPGWRFALGRQLGHAVSQAVINNVLVLILAAEFFTHTEALMAAMYTVPVFTLVPLLQAFGRWKTRLGGRRPDPC